jgi:hypothetical protein
LLAGLIEKKRGLNLPLGPPSSCVTAVVKEAQKDWPAHTQEFADDMAKLLEKECQKLLADYFREYPALAAAIRWVPVQMCMSSSLSCSRFKHLV